MKKILTALSLITLAFQVSADDAALKSKLE